MVQEGAKMGIKVTGVLKKFDCKPDGTEWTNEEINAGLADDYLKEVIHVEDGLITDQWRKSD